MLAKDIISAIDSHVDIEGLILELYDVVEEYISEVAKKTDSPWDDSAVLVAGPLLKNLAVSAAKSLEVKIEGYLDGEEEVESS